MFYTFSRAASQTVAAEKMRLDENRPMGYNVFMARELLFQTLCGASGDMILASMIDLLDAGTEFKKIFENIGLDVTVSIEDTEKNHLRCKKITVTPAAATQTTTWAQIETFIAATPFPPRVKDNAILIFKAIFAAEAAVHGRSLNNVHLHEIGADDSLVDILGFSFLWEKLACCPIFFTTLITGRGSILTQHGVLPVPPPAVLRLVEGLACRDGDIEDELLTPTGAAILATCGRQLEADHAYRPLKTGCGGGHKTFASVPNLLRVILAETDPLSVADRVWVLESNLDDMSPELLAHAADRIMQSGALDIFISPGLMKKGRPGFQLTVLCGVGDHDKVVAAIFRESTAIGLRQRVEERAVLPRETQKLIMDDHEILLKISSWQGRQLNIKPEFDSVRRFADGQHISVKEAMRMVQGAINEKYGSGKN
jgi:uncharacterized protein (TIGR00299 family) protein